MRFVSNKRLTKIQEQAIVIYIKQNNKRNIYLILRFIIVATNFGA